MNHQENKIDLSSTNEGKLCRHIALAQEENFLSSFDTHHPYIPNSQPNNSNLKTFPNISNNSMEDQHVDLSTYRYIFILAQIFHGIGASALISLGVTYLDESVSKKDAPVFIGIFEASFVLGPAIG